MHSEALPAHLAQLNLLRGSYHCSESAELVCDHCGITVQPRQKRTRPGTPLGDGKECVLKSCSLPASPGWAECTSVTFGRAREAVPSGRVESAPRTHRSPIALRVSYTTPPRRASDWCFPEPSGTFLCWMPPWPLQNRKTITHQLCGENIFLDLFFPPPNNEWEEIAAERVNYGFT